MKTARPSSMRLPFIMVILTIVLSACGSISTPPVANLPPAPKGYPPVPDIAEDHGPYRLQVGDILDIKLLHNPELNDQVTVLPDGRVSTSLAQSVPAYGRTIKQLKADLEKEYSKQLKQPQIAVMIRSFAPDRIYVTGEVVTPGEFITVGPELTLLQAIARAGGLKNSARPDEIIIVRRGAGEKPEVYAANYKTAVSGADAQSDVRLAPYDVVYVPRSNVGDVYLNYQQDIQQFLPPSFGIGYQFNSHTGTSFAP